MKKPNSAYSADSFVLSGVRQGLKYASNVPLWSYDLHTVRHTQAPDDKEKQTQERNVKFHHWLSEKQLEAQQQLKNFLIIKKTKHEVKQVVGLVVVHTVV